MPIRRSSWCGLTCLLAVAVSGCSSGSPEKTFQNWSAGVKSNNFAVIWENLSPQARGTVLQVQVHDADLLSTASSAAKTACETAYSRLGLNPADAGFSQQRLQVSNPAQLALDLDGVFRQFHHDLGKLPDSRYPKLQAIWSAAASAPLNASQVQGTRATAAVQGKIPHTADNASVSAVFEKVNGQWLLGEIEESQSAAATPAMAGGPGGPMAPGGMPRPGAEGPGVIDPARPAGAMPDPKAAMNSMPTSPMPLAGGPGAAMPPGDPAMAAKAAEQKSMAGGPAGPGAMAARDPAMTAKGAMPDPKMMAGGGSEMRNGSRPGAMLAGNGPGPMANMKRPTGPGAGDPKMTAGDAKMEPGGPEGAGNSQSAQGQGQPGSFEYAVTTFIAKVSSGQTDELYDVISPKARGVLAELRDQEANDSTLDDLKEMFSGAKPVAESVKNTGGSLIITVKTENGRSIKITAVKEKGEFRVKELKLP